METINGIKENLWGNIQKNNQETFSYMGNVSPKKDHYYYWKEIIAVAFCM